MKLIEWINGKTKLNKTTFDEFQNNIKEAAVPTGGTAGQVLAKNTDTDNDVKWVDQTGGITVVDNLTSTSTTDALSAKQGKVLNDKINGTVLYENINGSRYEITLNDSVENYSIIKIFYSNKTDYSSTEMYDANNKEICLMLSFSIEGLNIARTIYRNIKITKKQLKTTTQGYLSMITTGGVDSNISAAANDIYIHKIIGYN